MKLISILTTSLFLNTFLLGDLVKANQLNNLSTNNQKNSTSIAKNTAWNRTATIDVEVIGGKPAALVKEGYWDVYYNNISEQNPDIAICIQDEFYQTDCIPGHVNKPQNILYARCQDTYACNFPNVTLPSGKFKVVIVDVDVAANDLIGYGNCDVNSECQVGQARIKISANSENTQANKHQIPELPNGLTEAEVDRQAKTNGFPKAQYPYFSSPNACGPADSFKWHLVPNKPLGYDFTEACNHHDVCYMTSLDRNSCDETFLKEIRHLCYDLYKKETSLSICHQSAWRYYSAVRDNGQQPFENAQQKQIKYLTWLRQYIKNWQTNPSPPAYNSSSNDTDLLETKPEKANNSNKPVTEPLWGEPENIPETNESSPPTDPLF